MRIVELHPWDLSPQEAVKVQEQLASMVIEVGELPDLRFVAGIDVAAGPPARAAVAVLDVEVLQPVEVVVQEGALGFPYIPGLLSFREAPLILQALRQVEGPVDALLVDGQGRAHPRRFGIACHLGLLTQRPSVGCGKSLLVGHHAEVPQERGSWVPVVDRGEVVGAAVRTRPGTNPVYVSVGHMVSLESAVRLVIATAAKYRLPEPIRWAHRLAGSTKSW